jgi:hypothetical protein
LVRVSDNVIGDGRYLRHDQLAGLLQRSLAPATGDRGLVTFTPDGAGGYEIYSAAKTSYFVDAENGADEVGPDERRVAVFLDSAILV